MSHRPSFFKRIFGLSGGKNTSTEKAVEAPATKRVVPAFPNAIPTREAKYQIGQILRHRLFDFRGVVFDVDPVFANSEEWYQAIPEEVRPAKDQPYYHLFAENERTHYVAYVSEQNLMPDHSEAQVAHPDISKMFELTSNGYVLKSGQRN